MAKANGLKIWLIRVSAAIVVGALFAFIAVIQATRVDVSENSERITKVEVHIPYIKEKVDEIQTEQRVWFDKIEQKLEDR